LIPDERGWDRLQWILQPHVSISVFLGQNFRNPWPLARESAAVSS
jgi:hypothetical protein